MLTGIFIAILAILVVLLTRSITTLIHELGHAIPSLLFTKEEVIICVGSYENLNKSRGIKLGRLRAFFTLNAFNWNSGLCLHQGVTTFLQRFLIIVGGPLASLLVGLSMIYVIKSGRIAESYVVVFVFLLVSALWDFISNIIPQSKPLVTHNGNIVYNDGYQLQQLLEQRQLPLHQQKALELSRLNKHQEVLQVLQPDFPNQLKQAKVQEAYVTALLATKQTTDAEEVFYRFFGEKDLTSADWGLIGAIKFEQKQYDDALEAYKRAVYLDFKNPLLLHQKAWCYFHLGAYRQAIQIFTSSLMHQPAFYNAFIDRAYAYIKLGELPLAAQDLEQALTIKQDNAKTYFYLGLLKKEEKKNKEALGYLLKAEKMGFEHYGLDYYIAEVSQFEGQ